MLMAHNTAAGVDLPYFGIAAQQKMLKSTPDLGRRISAAFGDCASAIRADPSSPLRRSDGWCTDDFDDPGRAARVEPEESVVDVV